MPVIRIEYYHDASPEQPDAYERYTYRMANFGAEMAAWKTLVCDSMTFMELSARKREEKVLNPQTKFAKGTDTRQWFSGATDAMEEMAIMRYGSLPINVVLVCHVDERRNEVSGEILRGPYAPGRLSKRGLLCAAYQEQYHSFCFRDDKGRRVYALQTRNDGVWSATTQIDAPEVAYPSFDGIFVSRPALRDKPVHVMVYGDTGTGKSTFAATFAAAGNMLVHCFDPYGKEMPYLRLGKEVPEIKVMEIGGVMGVVKVPYRDVIVQ